MKTMKKAAALFFCLALALSVMAISASASGNDTQGDSVTFTVTLVQNTTLDTHTNIDTSDGLVEYNQGDTVVYNVMLAASSETNVSAVDFTLDIPDELNLATTNGVINAITSTTGNPQNAETTTDVIDENDITIYELNLTTSTTTGGTTTTTATTINSTPTAIATITMTVDDEAADDAALEFKVENVVIHKVSKKIEATNAGASATIKVDPAYTVSVYNPGADETTGILNQAQPGKDADNEDDLVYSFTYTLFNGDGVAIYAAQNGNNGEETVADFPGYTFAGEFAVYQNAGEKGSDTYAWTAGTKIEQDKSINDLNIAAGADSTPAPATNKWGNVKLIAQYTPVVYTVTYELDATDATFATEPAPPAGNTNNLLAYTAATTDPAASAKLTYTIESAATSQFGIPRRTGYEFKGWKVGEPTKTDKDYADISFDASFWSNYEDDGTFDFDTTKESLDTANMAYGNVTLTADWAVDGYMTVNYKYAWNNAMLVLYAVETAEAQARTYTYDGQPMFILNDTADNQYQNYYTLFGKTGEEYIVNDNDWTIYGYIAENPSRDNINFTAVEIGAESGNVSIEYDGDVNGNGTVNAGDYGIVIDLLAGLGDYNNALDIKDRLEAHINSDAVTTASDGTIWLGGIGDIDYIMTLVTVTPAP